VDHQTTSQGVHAIQYQVIIRESNNLTKSYDKQILVSQNPNNNVIQVQIVGSTSQVYEVISIFRLNTEQGNKVEVQLKGKKLWEIEFRNSYKTFQFMQ
jgi:hypothetical protein